MRIANSLLFGDLELTASSTSASRNKLLLEDQSAHRWYRFVLSFPPHLVQEYLGKLGVSPGATVLDPFCGTGTTLVECKKLGLNAIGIEANPMAHFASRTKLNWKINADSLEAHADRVVEVLGKELGSSFFTPLDAPDVSLPPGLRSLPQDSEDLLLSDSISPLPQHKALVLLERIDQDRKPGFHAHERLALAKGLVNEIGNLHFGPEVGVGLPKADAPVLEVWRRNVAEIAADVRSLRTARAKSIVHLHDSRSIPELIGPNSVDAVITSPPYPNEKDYTRTTRLESVILGFITDKDALRRLKKTLVRSNTRNIYKGDDDDQWIRGQAEVQRVADEIENRRIALGKTSGFERMYAKVTRQYFGGMARHLKELQRILKPGARLGYVVGDQASYFRILIRTGQILADIAASLGYRVLGLDLFRTRLSTTTRDQLREEVVLLEWPGPRG